MLYKIFTDRGNGGLGNTVDVTIQALQRFLKDDSVTVITIFKDGINKDDEKREASAS